MKFQSLVLPDIKDWAYAGCKDKPVQFKFNLKSNLTDQERETLSSKIFLAEPNGMGIKKALKGNAFLAFLIIFQFSGPKTL